MNFEVMHPAEQLCTIIDRVYSFGMTTTSGGNLSVMDSDGDIWITPGDVYKRQVYTAKTRRSAAAQRARRLQPNASRKFFLSCRNRARTMSTW